MQKADGRPAQDAVSPIDLPEIFDTIRNDEPAHQGPLPPPEAKAVSHKPSRPRDAEAEPLAAASDERASDPASTESVAAARPNSQGSRVPIITASSSVSMDAAERMRRLEEEKLRLARKPERVRELSGEAEEAAVTFVIREQAQEAPPPPAVPSTPSRSSTLLRRTRLAGEAAEAEAYVANRGSAEEAEVVVIKPVVQNRYGQAATSEAGPVRRLLKALRGG